MTSQSIMSEEARLRLVHDGKSNVLVIRRGSVDGVHDVVVDFCKDLPNNRDELDADNSVVSRIAGSSDFVCSHANCCYHHKSESKYILHARSHFVFEVLPGAAVYDTEFKCVKGRYVCSKCPRSTTDWISFREHIRHHIFQKPYTCSLCLIEISSVPDLRLHFQKCHAGKSADFEFNGSVYELNSLLNLLLPDAPAVTEPLSISFKLPVHMTTRICCTSASGISHPVIVMRQLLSRNCPPAAKRPEISVSESEKNTAARKVPGKYIFSHGVYKCMTCRFEMRTEMGFTRHVWKHVHGSSWSSTCSHNTGGTLSSECAIVKGLIAMVKKVELTRAIDSLRMSETESSEASASTANNENTTLQTGAVPNVAARTDFSPSGESYVDDDVLSQMAADEIVVLRHSRSPLKVRCDRCSFTCDNELQLEIHMTHGHESVPSKSSKHFRCPECSMSSVKREIIIWHLSHHIGNHSTEYYACSSCDVERQYPSDMWNHIRRKHSRGSVQATSVKHVENVRYLQNIMKCPVCKDGLLWKEVYINHIRGKHELFDLAIYLNSNYSNNCPDSISFPRHLLRSYANRFVSDSWDSSETVSDSNLHNESHRLRTNNSDAQCQQQNKPGPSRMRPTQIQKEDDKYARTKPNQTAKVKTNREKSKLRTSDSEAKRQSRSNHGPARTESSSYRKEDGSSITDETDVPFNARTKPSRSAKLKANRLLSESSEFDSNGSDGQWELEYDHSPPRKESSSVPKEHNIVTAETDMPSSFLYQPNRTAKIKANSLIIAPPLMNRQKQHSKRKDGSHQKSIAIKRQSSKRVVYSGPYQHFKRTISGADRPDASKNVVAKPKAASDTDLSAEFINKLPSSHVFAGEIKCPHCYFASKVRVNLVRHIKSHATTSDKGSASASGIQSNEQLSYNLWKESSDRDRRIAAENRAVEEPATPVISDERTESAPFISLNDRDNKSPERRTTSKRDSFSQSESIDSSSVCAIADSLDDDDDDDDDNNEAGDEMPVPSERQLCESCSEQFDSVVDLEQHIAESHGGLNSCHVGGTLMHQKSSVQENYGTVHPSSPVRFLALHKKSVEESQEVVGTSKSNRKIARVQGITQETLTKPPNVSSTTSPQQQKESSECTAAGGSGSSLPMSSTSQTALPTANAMSSTLPANVSPITVTDNASCSSVPPTSIMNPFISQLLSFASSTSAGALTLDPLMAAVNMNITTMAAQLVPVLASMDLRLLLQMVQLLQATNPQLAAVVSTYIAMQTMSSSVGPAFAQTAATSTMSSSVDSCPPTAAAEASSGSEALQASVNVSNGLLPESVEVPPSTASVRCASTVSSDGLPSSVSSWDASAAGASASHTSVSTDLPQFTWKRISPERQHASSDVPRPSSTTSDSSSMYSRDTASSSRDAVSYSCHLCSFQSLHKTRFAEHMSSEFSTTNIAAMARQELDGKSTRRKRCIHCAFSTYLAVEFDDHVRTHMSSSLYRCDHCDYTSSIGIMKLHYRRNHRYKSFNAQPVMSPKPRADDTSRDQSRPHSVHLDPVVKLYNVKTLSDRRIRKLMKRHNLTRIDLS